MRGARFAIPFIVAFALVAVPTCGGPAFAQGTRCSAFLHDRDGSWRSFTDDEMLLPGGPLPIHKGQRFSRGMPGPFGLVARLLDAQCRPGGPLY